MEWLSLGWRDGILILVVLAAVYLVMLLLKLLQVGRQRQTQVPLRAEPEPTERFDTVSPLRQRNEPEARPPVPEPASRAAIAAYAEAMGEPPPHEPFAVRPAPTFEWDDVQELFGEDVAPAPAPAPVQNPEKPAVPRGSGFGESLSTHLARSQVEEEIQRMRDEMERMRREMEELRATRRVSPQYAEAMELVQRGLTAQDVADQLGISLAEAELVHALSRSQQNFDEGEADGAEGYAVNDGLRHRSAG